MAAVRWNGRERGEGRRERRDGLYSLLVSSVRTGELSGHWGVELYLFKKVKKNNVLCCPNIHKTKKVFILKIEGFLLLAIYVFVFVSTLQSVVTH